MFSLLLSFLFSTTNAATIAVIDSGVDVEHKDLISNIWINSKEVADNGRDEDRNAYPDDVYGWNFAESNNRVIERKYIGTFTEDPKKFFEIQGRMFLGMATEQDKAWLDSKRGDENFRKEMGIFGNFVHGTHVAGITVKGNDSEILSVKLIPTEVKPFLEQELSSLSAYQFDDDFFSKIVDKFKAFLARYGIVIPGEVTQDGIRMTILRKALGALAKQQMNLLEEIAAYVGSHKADIANGSFGTGYAQAKMITDNAFRIVFFRKPTTEESDKVAKIFLNAVIREGRKMVAAAPDTLFVFAAGNDGSNNDIYPTSPTNIDADNVISVAATYKYDFIAPFSNYGIETVDIAAPGMLINSQIPGDDYLPVSGTSQAAPYVANVAAIIKDENPDLSPKQIKRILMGTVDKKDFLSDKVKSGGIVNLNRARTAAQMSNSIGVLLAIQYAKMNVEDYLDNSKFANPLIKMDPNAVIPMALPSPFKL